MRGRRLVLLAGVVLTAGLAGLGAWAYHKTTRPDYRLRQGQEAARRGDYARADELAALLEADGHPDHAHLLRAESFYRLAHPDRDGDRPSDRSPLLGQALTELGQVQDQGDLGLDAVALAGQCLLHLNQHHDAEQAFRLVLARRPDDADAYRGMAAIYYDQGALGRAVAELEQVARLDREDGRPHRLMGLIYRDLGQPDAAIAYYREALRRKLGGRVAQEVRVELAGVLARAAAYGEGLEVLNGCDEETAATSEARTLRAECLWGNGDTSTALALLDQVLADKPNEVLPLVLRARIHIGAGEDREAAALLERAVAINPGCADCRYQLALAYRGLGRTRDAAEQQRLADQVVAEQKEMARLNDEANQRPWDAEVRRRLAALCEQRGKPDEAAMWLKAAAACAQAGSAEPRAPAPSEASRHGP
jgi:tetratricopeptide (TPR) repeat protein